LLHGTADWRVSPRDAMDMADRLYALKRPFRLVLFEGGDHGLSEFRTEADKATRDFLDSYVRDGSPLPNMEPHGR
jgi:dipeptidyl aminopeptidase/acylaminoacyl peptidase